MPEDIKRAAVLLTASLHLSSGRDPLLRSVNIPDVGAESYLDPKKGHEELPPQVSAMLAAHRDWTSG
jgi:hypothetical protein